VTFVVGNALFTLYMFS